MQVHMGNTGHSIGHGEPAVYSWGVPDGEYTHVAEGRPHGQEARRRAETPNPQLPDHEAFVSVINDFKNHSTTDPTWVDSDNADLAQMLAEAYGDIPVGTPPDVEQTHHTVNGPPGVSGPTVPEEG